jgi:hypothetical protein
MIRLLLALAPLLLTGSQAHADFGGRLERNLPWMVEVDNTAPDETAVTVLGLSGRARVLGIVTVSALATEIHRFTVPKGTRRIVVTIDPPPASTVAVRIVQGANVFVATVEGTRQVVFDVP